MLVNGLDGPLLSGDGFIKLHASAATKQNLLRAAAMKRRGLMYMLLSGCVLVCRLQSDGCFRHFYGVATKMTWSEAQTYCKKNFTDLASIWDLDHNAKAAVAARDNENWIGLFNTSSWQWSQQEGVNVSMATIFSNWTRGEPTQDCVTVSADGTWSTQDCSTLSYLMCYSANSNCHILVTEKKNWSDAQTYCRSKYTDLSTVGGTKDNLEIANLINDTVPAAWIGLHRNFWMWSDASKATYRSWKDHEPDTKLLCAKMQASEAAPNWKTDKCTEVKSFICYSDVCPDVRPDVRAVALRSVTVRVRGGSVEMNDPAVQDAMLRQLQQKLKAGGLGGVKLRWRKQSDGKVFHREDDPPIHI